MEKAVVLSYDTFDSEESRSDLCPIVLMHGLFWNKFMLKDIARDISKVTQRKVFSLDLRNHGESPNPEDCDCFLMAEDIKRFLDEKHLRRVSFVCQSFSGTMAYLVGLDRPEAIEKIEMVDSPPFYEFSERSIRRLVLPQITTQNRLLNILDPKMTLMAAKFKFLKLAETAPSPATPLLKSASTLDPPRVDAKIRTQRKKHASFYKKAAYDLTKENCQFRWKIDMEFLMEKYHQKAFAVDAKGSSNHEILMIRCPGSQRVPDSKFEAMLKFNPKAKLVTIEDTTHLLMFEKPEEFIEVVKDFLCTQEGTGS